MKQQKGQTGADIFGHYLDLQNNADSVSSDLDVSAKKGDSLSLCQPTLTVSYNCIKPSTKQAIALENSISHKFVFLSEKKEHNVSYSDHKQTNLSLSVVVNLLPQLFNHG
jgi:hypothetical protein